MNNDLAEIGQRIEKVMRENRISRARIGQFLGVGHGAIGRYIRGEADAGAIFLSKIASICNVTTDWLITGVEIDASIVAESGSEYLSKDTATLIKLYNQCSPIDQKDIMVIAAAAAMTNRDHITE